MAWLDLLAGHGALKTLLPPVRFCLFSILSVGLFCFLHIRGCSQASGDPWQLLAFTWAALACLLDGCPAHAYMGDASGSPASVSGVGATCGE